MQDITLPLARTRYIESFDGVRFPVTDLVERQGRILHAEVELFTSLLYGDRMAMAETTSFDSDGFLEIAGRVLEARARMQHSPWRLKDCPIAEPFQLAWRKGWDPSRSYSSFQEMVAYHVAKDHEAFMLSAWPEFSMDTAARTRIAIEIENGSFGSAMTHAAQASMNYAHGIDVDRMLVAERVKQRIDNLRTVTHYFQQTLPQLAAQPATSMPDYFTHLETYLADRQNLEKWNEEWLDAILTFIQALKSEKVPFVARNAFHAGQVERLAEAHEHGKPLLALLQEYADGVYNRVIQRSLRAPVGTFSTKGSADESPIRIAEELTTIVDAMIDGPPARTWINDFRIEDFAGAEVRQYEPVPPTVLWGEFWEIVTTDQWRASYATLVTARDNAVVGSDESRKRFEDAYHNHTEVLQRELGRRVRILITERNDILGTLFRIPLDRRITTLGSFLLPPLGSFLVGQEYDFGDDLIEMFLLNAAFESKRFRRVQMIGSRTVRPIARLTGA